MRPGTLIGLGGLCVTLAACGGSPPPPPAAATPAPKPVAAAPAPAPAPPPAAATPSNQPAPLVPAPPVPQGGATAYDSKDRLDPYQPLDLTSAQKGREVATMKLTWRPRTASGTS